MKRRSWNIMLKVYCMAIGRAAVGQWAGLQGMEFGFRDVFLENGIQRRERLPIGKWHIGSKWLPGVERDVFDAISRWGEKRFRSRKKQPVSFRSDDVFSNLKVNV
ncbi:hypothetical protein TNCV_558871 [Trichonephila clavipes]|nr:hypothetical protein TNCV_558871 [Trichonephila clavipes]